MMRATFVDLNILRSVVLFVAVDMMDFLVKPQWSAECVFGDDAMLVGIAAHIGKMMFFADTD